MKTSQRGIDLIKRHEGLVLHAYPDPGSGGEPWTIGYGSTHGVVPGMRITEAQADEMLLRDLPIYEKIVAHGVKAKITQGQFDALVSLVYNIGARNFLGSTCLRKLNEGDTMGAANAMLMFDKAAHHYMAGLHQRRIDEREVFLA